MKFYGHGEKSDRTNTVHPLTHFDRCLCGRIVQVFDIRVYEYAVNVHIFFFLRLYNTIIQFTVFRFSRAVFIPNPTQYYYFSLRNLEIITLLCNVDAQSFRRYRNYNERCNTICFCGKVNYIPNAAGTIRRFRRVHSQSLYDRINVITTIFAYIIMPI